MNTLHCPNCGAENQAEDRFCVDCGKSLSQAPPVASPDVEHPRSGQRRRLGLIAALLVLAVLIVAGVSVIATGVLPLPGSPDRDAEADGDRAIATEEPFLIVLTPQDLTSEVLAIDLEGKLLADLGPATGQSAERPFSIWDAQHYELWFGSDEGIAGASAYAWPDSNTALLALQGPTGWDLLRYDASTAQVHELVRAADSIKVTGRPDAPTVLVQAESRGGQDLWALGLGGQTMIKLAEESGAINGFNLSPDGQQATFPADRSYVAQTDGKRTHRLSQAYDTAIFSPDGQRLLLGNSRQLVRSDADGRNGAIIVEVGRNDSLITAGVGDKLIMALQQAGGRYELRVLDWDGAETGSMEVDSVSLVGDFLSGEEALWMLHRPMSADMQLEVATSDGKERHTLIESADDMSIYTTGKHMIAANRQNGAYSLLVLDTKSLEQQEIAVDLIALEMLALAGEKIAFVAYDGDRWHLMIADLDRNETWELDAGAPGGYPVAFFDREGRRLVYEARHGYVSTDLFNDAGEFLGVQNYLDADIYLVDVQEPDPQLVFERARLLASSLRR